MRHYGPDETPYDLGDNPIRSEFNYTIEDGQRTKLEETFYFDHDNNPATPDQPQTNVYDWVYDDNNRLLSETIDHFDNDLDRTESFVMDLFGNRLERTIDYDAASSLTDQAFAYSYDDNDRLTSETLDTGNNGSVDQTTTYSWSGTQQTSKTVSGGQSQTFEYDLQGRLSRVVTTPASGSKTRVDYDYDSSGIRISATEFTDSNNNGSFESSEQGDTTEYLIDHRNHTGYAQTIVETTRDSGGQKTRRVAYTFGTDEITQTATDYVAGVAQTPEAHTFGHDAHGSVRVLFDAAGALEQAYTYAAYGELLAIHNGLGVSVGTSGASGLEAQALTSLLYSGESFDSRIGQQYLHARWYDTAAGRFSRLDPYFGNLNDPLSFNEYNYVHSNPIAGVDPTGHQFSLGGIIGGIGIAGRIAARVLVGSHLLALGYWGVGDLHAAFSSPLESQQAKALFNYYFKFLDANRMTIATLAANGASGLHSEYPWLGIGYNLSSGREYRDGELHTTGQFASVGFPKHFAELERAMAYVATSYSDFGKQRIRDGSSFNLHAYSFPYMPGYLNRDGFTGRISTEDFVGGNIVHEPMHDFAMYGAGHTAFKHIVPTIDDMTGGDAWTKLINFYRAAKDGDGKSLLSHIHDWIGPRPPYLK